MYVFFHFILLIIMAVVDAVWLSMNWFRYTDNARAIQKEDMKPWKIIALPIYAIMYVALFFIAFPLVPAYSFGAGTLVGGAIYGVYNLSLLFQFQQSSVVLACMDTAWGAALFTFLVWLAVVFDGIPVH